MAQVTYIRPVESVHGKLKKTDQVGYAMRGKSKTKYTVTRDSWKRTFKSADSQASAEALNRKFAAVSKLAQQRMVDPERMDEDQLNFRNQTKYTTFFGYLFHLEWEDYQG